MLYKTRGIVLRTVKYGETSVVVNILTELFGIQSYIVNGVRTEKKSRSPKANLLQPATILELVVYFRENKNLQRISEFHPGYLYKTLHSVVIKNMVALYIVELLQKTLKQPETHEMLYNFAEEALRALDGIEGVAANLPLYFTLRLAALLGFRINGRFSPSTSFLNLAEGIFVNSPPHHPYYLDEETSRITDRLLWCPGVEAICSIYLNKEIRRRLLSAYLEFIKLHIPDFTELKSVRVLQEILE